MVTTRLGNPNVFATLPFDKIDGYAGGFIHDDFDTTAVLADFVDASSGAVLESAVQWRAMEIAGGAAVANSLLLEGEADHVGILQLQTGSTTPADADGCAIQLGADVVAGQNTLVLDTSGVYIATVLRVLDVSDAQVEFGFCGQAPVEANSSAADIVSFVWDPADAANVGDEFWFAQVNSATVDTEVVAALPYVEADWVLLEIGATDTSAHFRITTEDGTETMSINGTMPLVGLRPFFSVTNVGAAEEFLDIDLFHMRYLRRGKDVADYLGA